MNLKAQPVRKVQYVNRCDVRRVHPIAPDCTARTSRTKSSDRSQPLEYLIKQYPLETGALEIQYIEEYFGEFPRKKTAQESSTRLREREFLILMAEAPLPDDPGIGRAGLVQDRARDPRRTRPEPKLVDLVARLEELRAVRRTQGALQLDRRHAPRLARPGTFPRADRRVGGVGARVRLPRGRRQDEEPLLRHARHARSARVQRHQVPRSTRPTTASRRCISASSYLRRRPRSHEHRTVVYTPT